MKKILEEKKELRKVLVQRRNEINHNLRNNIDNAIIENIKDTLEYINAINIFVFVGVESEINTVSFIESALEEGKKIYVPLCFKKGKMEARRITSLSELHPNKLGLLEPADKSETIELSKIDLSIIPCLSVDREGYRLGYGGGYYDRYFSDKNYKHAFVICRESFIVEKLPHDKFDVNFKVIVSEDGIYRL